MKKMSDLKKGDYAVINGGLSEVLKTIADKERDRTWVSYRSIQACSDFDRFFPASKEVDVPAELVRKEYVLVSSLPLRTCVVILLSGF